MKGERNRIEMNANIPNSASDAQLESTNTNRLIIAHRRNYERLPRTKKR